MLRAGDDGQGITPASGSSDTQATLQSDLGHLSLAGGCGGRPPRRPPVRPQAQARQPRPSGSGPPAAALRLWPACRPSRRLTPSRHTRPLRPPGRHVRQRWRRRRLWERGMRRRPAHSRRPHRTSADEPEVAVAQSCDEAETAACAKNEAGMANGGLA
jgi:hypothetical protein